MAAGSVGLQEAGMSLEIIANKPPTSNSVEAVIYNAANQALAENDARRAVDQLRNPGRILTTKEVGDVVTDIFKKDSLTSSADALGHSAGQKGRRDEAVLVSKAIVSLAENGYDKLNSSEKKLLKDQLSEVFFNHPVFQLLEGSSPDFKKKCEDMAVLFLKNTGVGFNARNSLVDVLVNGKIDYTKLQTALNERITLEKQIKKLTDEIGVAGASGLEKELADKIASLEKFKYSRTIAGGTVTITANGPEAEAYQKAQTEFAEAQKKINAFQLTARELDIYFRKPGATKITITDPFGGGDVDILDAGQWLNIKANWQSLADAAEKTMQEKKLMMTVLDQEQKDLKEEIDRLTKERDAKRKELERLQELRGQKINEITAEQGAIEGKERELLLNVKKSLTDAALDRWLQTHEAVKAAKPEAQKKAETDIARMAEETVMSKIWSETKKSFTEQLDKELSLLLEGGVEKYGADYLTVLIDKANSSTSSPELKKLLPYMLEIASDPAKKKAFGLELSKYILRVVVAKDPNKLKNKFTRDEIIHAAITGNVLPDLFEQAMSDQTIATKLEQHLGKGLTKTRFQEMLGNFDWKTLLMILAVLLGLGTIIGVTQLR